MQQTLLTRKRDQILTCGYGHHWPLNLHTKGFVLVTDPDALRYVWSPDRATLERLTAR